MVWGHDHSPRYNYHSDYKPRGVYSYSPQFWRRAAGGRMPSAVLPADESMRTAVYVGAGALGLVAVGSLIYLMARKQ